MSRNITFLILYFISIFCSAQDLQEMYQTARENSDLKLAETLKNLAIDNNDMQIQANTCYLIGYLQKKDDKFYEAATNYFEAIRLYRQLEGNDHSLTNALLAIGNIYRLSGFKDTGLNYYMNALDIQEELKDSLGIIYSSYNIGQVLWESEELDSALVYYEKALILAKSFDSTYIGRIYNDIGTVYRAKKYYEKAREYYDLALQYENSIRMNVWTLNNRGNIYLEEGNHKKAYEYFKKALAQDLSKVEDRTLSKIYGNIGKIQDKPDSAIFFYEKSFSYLKNKPFTLASEYYETCKELERLFKEKGDEDKATLYDDHQDKFTFELIDLQEKLRKLYLRYQVEAATWKEQAKQHAAKLEKQNETQQYIILALLISMVGLIVFFILYAKRKKWQNQMVKRATQVHEILQS